MAHVERAALLDLHRRATRPWIIDIHRELLESLASSLGLRARCVRLQLAQVSFLGRSTYFASLWIRTQLIHNELQSQIQIVGKHQEVMQQLGHLLVFVRAGGAAEAIPLATKLRSILLLEKTVLHLDVHVLDQSTQDHRPVLLNAQYLVHVAQSVPAHPRLGEQAEDLPLRLLINLLLLGFAVRLSVEQLQARRPGIMLECLSELLLELCPRKALAVLERLDRQLVALLAPVVKLCVAHDLHGVRSLRRRLAVGDLISERRRTAQAAKASQPTSSRHLIWRATLSSYPLPCHDILLYDLDAYIISTVSSNISHVVYNY